MNELEIKLNRLGGKLNPQSMKTPNPENKHRKELFDLINEMQDEVNLDPDVTEQLAKEAVAAVRKSRASIPPGDESPG